MNKLYILFLKENLKLEGISQKLLDFKMYLVTSLCDMIIDKTSFSVFFILITALMTLINHILYTNKNNS